LISIVASSCRQLIPPGLPAADIDPASGFRPCVDWAVASAASWELHPSAERFGISATIVGSYVDGPVRSPKRRALGEEKQT
jgi:hypothetical protein